MNEDLIGLREILTSRKVAALGTLHGGAPFVSMVPFALLEDGSAFLIHVSELSAHTQDMLTDSRVSLLITEFESAETLPQALARVTVLGQASPIDDDARSTLLRWATWTDFPIPRPCSGSAIFRCLQSGRRRFGGSAGSRPPNP